MGNIIIRPKSREEWLKCREGGIGSSEVGTILGLNPWETPYQLWRRKKGLDAPKEENFAMKAGHYLEDAVSRFWQDATGREVIKSSAGDWIIQNSEKSFLQVSPDRTFWTGDGRGRKDKGICECKTTQMKIDGDDLPKHWFVQLQYQLGVAELEQGSLAWLTQGREFGYRDIMFVPDFFAWVEEEVTRFWTDHIVGGTEPAATEVSDLLLKYGRHTDGKVIEVGDEEFRAYEELKGLRDEIAELETHKTELEDRLKMCFEDAESISYCGQTLATWKAPKASSRFDAKAFGKDHPELYSEYCREAAGQRRFVLK